MPKKAPRGTAGQRGKATKTSKRTSTKASAVKESTTAARGVRPGFIAHTELASRDPEATKAWAQKVLGWTFGPSMPTPGGPYHMWDFGNSMGGGIRALGPGENPGAIPYCEVKDIQAAFAKATKAGAVPMMPPEEIPGGMGSIAVVVAPGGPAIGFWAPK